MMPADAAGSTPDPAPVVWVPAVVSAIVMVVPDERGMQTLRPQYDFVIDNVSFAGSPADLLVYRIIVGDIVAFRDDGGVLVAVWEVQQLGRNLKGQRIRGGLDITVEIKAGAGTAPYLSAHITFLGCKPRGPLPAPCIVPPPRGPQFPLRDPALLRVRCVYCGRYNSAQQDSCLGCGAALVPPRSFQVV